MLFGVPGLKRIAIACAVLLVVSLILVSCTGSAGYGSSSSTTAGGTTTATTTKPSRLAVRAFITNPLFPSGTVGAFGAVLNIVDASLDQLSFSYVNLTGASAHPGLTSLSPDKKHMMVFSSSDDSIVVVNALSETQASNATGSFATSILTLPGLTESMLIGTDNVTAYAAVPTAPVTSGNPTPGAIAVMNLATISLTATIPVPAARYVVESHKGTRLLAFGEGSNVVTVIAPSSIGTADDPRTPVCCFDHPAWAIFSSDDSKAYILECGPECGGTTAGISVLDLTTNPVSVTATLPLAGAGATIGLLSGSTVYVAGTPPGTACPSGTAATTCGTLDIVDLGSMTVTSAMPIAITDGYHHRMEISNNGQLFIGATTCSNINNASEVRGCLSIFNTSHSTVVIPPDNGDVTGIQPITNRNVVYLCEGGYFRIYDTTTDKLQVPPAGQSPIVVVGDAVDVKLVD
jgi:hypothetical protein